MPPAERALAATSARVVADSGGVFVHTLLVDAGAEQGVRDGMAAVNAQGLVGRVVDVGRRSARVLLVTDLNSRIPVVLERSGDQAILEGDNSPEPVLRFLPMNPGLAVGDRVLTSGRGGLLPPGLLIGQISRIGGRGVAVRPFVDWSRLDYLSLLRDAAAAEVLDSAPPGTGSATAPAAARRSARGSTS
jgi:rod shape-determining protein MreC